MAEETAKKPIVRFFVDVYRVVKFLDLQSSQMTKNATGCPADHPDQKMKWMCTRGNVHQVVKDEHALLWINELVLGIGDTYKWNTKTPKRMLMEFVWTARAYFLGTGWIGIKGRLDKVPGFIDDMLRRCAVSPWRKTALYAPMDEISELSYGTECARFYAVLPRTTRENPDAAVGQLWDPFNLTADNAVRREWCRRCAACNTIPWRRN